MHAPSPRLSPIDLEALSVFRSLLPARARVLDAGCGAGLHLQWFHAQSCDVLGVDVNEVTDANELTELNADSGGNQKLPYLKKDLRFFSAEEGSYEGIWCHRVFPSMKPEEMQRMLATFFKALIPSGVLFVSYRDWAGGQDTEASDKAFLSLLRQSGFTTLMQSNNAFGDFGDGAEKAVIARRA